MSVRRTGSGPALVWIHGLGESSTSFDPCVRHAALDGYSHVLVDLPGYGRSAHADAPEALEPLADHLAAWLAREAPAVVIGHSMGGVLATFIAERTPVRGIVNIDGNLSRDDCNFSAQVLPYTIVDFARHGFAAMRDRVYADGAASPPLRGYHAAMCFASPAVFYGHARDLVALSEREELAPRLAALTVPALYLAGVPDGICAHSRALLASHGIRWLPIEPAGHWLYLDQPDAFAAAVAEFAAAL